MARPLPYSVTAHAFHSPARTECSAGDGLFPAALYYAAASRAVSMSESGEIPWQKRNTKIVGKEKRRIMKGNPKVIDSLNEALHEELTAILQYFLHAEMCENWHYDRLGELVKKQSIGEMKHAEALIERILFLDGTPNLTRKIDLTVGKNVKEQVESDLKLEVEAVGMYNRAIETARQGADNTSRELFERLLKDEEEHVDFLEAQIHQMNEMGYERYLSQQISEEE
jgi:bacterioferritin